MSTSSGDVSADLVQAIIDNMMGGESLDWDQMAMVIGCADREAFQTHGYVYMADGSTEPVATRSRAISPAVRAFIDSRYAPDLPGPVKMVVQFDYVNGSLSVIFEDQDRSRWSADPSDVYALREEIRPDFSETDFVGDALTSLIRSIGQQLDDAGDAGPPDDWESFSIVIDTAEGCVTAASGFVYLPDGGFAPSAPDPDELQPDVSAFLGTLVAPGDAWPAQVLVQYSRTEVLMKADFADADDPGWGQPADDTAERAEMLRPNFDEPDDSEPGDTEPADETVLEGLVRAIVENRNVSFNREMPDDWEAFSVIIGTGNREVNSTSGYYYLSDGTVWANAPDAIGIQPAVSAYLDTLYSPDEEWPLQILVQFDGRTRRARATFEDDDESRWKVDFSDLTALPQKIRPDFASSDEG